VLDRGPVYGARRALSRRDVCTLVLAVCHSLRSRPNKPVVPKQASCAQTSQLCPKEHAVGSVCHGVPWRSDENHTTCFSKDAGCRDADHPQQSSEFRRRRRKEFTKPAPRLAWLRLNSESQYCRSSLAQCLLTRSSWSSSNRASNAPSSSPVPQSAHGIPASS